MTERNESFGSNKELIFTKAEVDALNLRIKDLENQLKTSRETIDELEEVHSKIKDEMQLDGTGYKPIEVPAMINRARVIAACIDVENTASCKHVKEFIKALRGYITNNLCITY